MYKRQIVGRDIAHAKLKERLDRGEDLPQYIKDHPIYYAGPAKTPEGMACGSMGPTTAGRMDSYVELFQSHEMCIRDSICCKQLPFQKRRSGIDLFLSRTATFGSRSLCARIRSCSKSVES